jgi:hypothetical protein
MHFDKKHTQTKTQLWKKLDNASIESMLTNTTSKAYIEMKYTNEIMLSTSLYEVMVIYINWMCPNLNCINSWNSISTVGNP